MDPWLLKIQVLPYEREEGYLGSSGFATARNSIRAVQIFLVPLGTGGGAKDNRRRLYFTTCPLLPLDRARANGPPLDGKSLKRTKPSSKERKTKTVMMNSRARSMKTTLKITARKEGPKPDRE